MNIGMKFKQVNFNWSYNSDVPPLWKRFIVAGGKGYVVFALHDDGWRYDGIEFEHSEIPFPRSETEIAGEQKEIRQIETQKRKEEEKERTAKQERQKRIAESKKATRDLGTFILPRRNGTESCKVSDAGVSCKKIEDGVEESYAMMFVDIKSIRKSFYPGPASSEQYSAIELEKFDSQMASWRYYTQWISENKPDIDKFLNTLTSAHKEWQKKFSDIAK